jgi:hypothetical protein
MTGGRYQDLEQMWTTRDGQEHFPPEGFEQGDGGWEKILTRALLERDVFWTHAQSEARCAISFTLQSGPGSRWQRKAACCADELQ